MGVGLLNIYLRILGFSKGVVRVSFTFKKKTCLLEDGWMRTARSSTVCT